MVAVLVKVDDVGLRLAQRSSPTSQKVGRGLVTATPRVLTVISVVGTAAMLWVGGHIQLVGLDDLGWHPLYDFVHHLEEDVEHAVAGIGGALGWLVNTAALRGVRPGPRVGDPRSAAPAPVREEEARRSLIRLSGTRSTSAGARPRIPR